MKKLLGLLLVLQAFTAFATTPVFNLVPVGVLPTSVSPGQTVTASYTVTNTTTYTLKNNGLRFAPEGQTPIGVTQVTGGAGVCANPFTLDAGASCTLNLLITANNLVNGVAVGGPEICSTISHPAHCSIPTTANQLNVSAATLNAYALAVGTDTTAGFAPYFVYTDDAGTSWQVGNVPSPVPAAGEFISADCNTSICSIVGILQNSPSPIQPYILYTTTGSTSWQIATTTPAPAAETNSLVSVSCGPGICVAVGATNNVGALRIQTTDDGASWQLTNESVVGAQYFNVSCSSTICVIVGDDQGATGALLRQSKYNGSVWSAWTSPVMSPGINSRFEDVSCDGNLCVAVGSLTSGGNGIIYVTTNGGTSWAVPSGTLPGSLTQRPLSAVSCTGTTCVAGGANNVSSTSFLMMSTDSGTNWTEIISPAPTASQRYQDISCSPYACVAIAGVFSIPLITQSVAPFTTWTSPSVPYPAADTLPLSVSCTSVFCLIGGTTGAASIPFLVQTQDAGTNWTTSVVSGPGLPSSGAFLGVNASAIFTSKHQDWDDLSWFRHK